MPRPARSARELIEDHALEPVPAAERHSWLQMSWSTVGIVTTLIQLYVGALITFMAGMKIGLLAGAAVAVLGALLGWGVGHVAYRSGLPSGLVARRHGFGMRGSVVASAIFGFMLIGFIAAENVLLYQGFLFYFGAEDTVSNRVLGYGPLTLAWILLTAYGFEAVTRVSSLMLIGFLAVLGYMLLRIAADSSMPWCEIVGFGPQFSPVTQAEVGATSDWGRFVFCINVLSGSAGALALLDADLGRYARRSIDIGVAAALGNLFLDVVMIFIGAVIMFAGLPALVAYYTAFAGLPPAEARQVAIASPDRIAAAFIIFGGLLGAVLMFAAQSKAQVLNTYSSSLSLANLCDAASGWRPGRLFFVVVANACALVFLYGDILAWFKEFLVVLGVLTTCFAGIMVADYFLVQPRLDAAARARSEGEAFNRAGLLSLAIAYLLAHHVLVGAMPIEVLTALAVSFAVYPPLRLRVFAP